MPTAKRNSLSGKVAIVTGGAGFLGKQHCHALAAEGCQVVIVDILREPSLRLASDLVAKYGVAACFYLCDVTQPDQVEQLRDSVIRDLGGVHILVNNAANDPKVDGLPSFGDLRLEGWNRDLAVGLTSYEITSNVIGVNYMYANGGGVIVNIASDLSVIAPNQDLYPDDKVKPASYSALKHGVIGLTKWYASALAPRVRVNAISPGGFYNYQPAEFVSRLTKLIPMRRMADTGDVSGTLVYLCSDASEYVTGQNIVVDGGRSII